jgi:hypothetical protein
MIKENFVRGHRYPDGTQKNGCEGSHKRKSFPKNWADFLIMPL